MSSNHSCVLLIASVGDDALMMARLRQQLYSMLPAHHHVVVQKAAWGQTEVLSARAQEAETNGGYARIFYATHRGVFYELERRESLDALEGLAPCPAIPDFCYGNAHDAYSSVIARPDRPEALLQEVARENPQAVCDYIPLKSDKNEWIEAGFIVAQLAMRAGKNRHFYVLPGKRYHLQPDLELFSAKLTHGATCYTSDLRSLYLLDHAIDYAQSNFTRAQLLQVAKLPAVITPVYVHGNGSITLNTAYAEICAQQDGDSVYVRFGEQSMLAWQVPHEGISLICGPVVQLAGHPLPVPLAQLELAHGNAWEALGRPQPGDAIEIDAQPPVLQAAAAFVTAAA